MAGIREILVGLCEAFNAHDLDAIMEFFADECILYMPRGVSPRGDTYVGRAAVRAGLALAEAERELGLPITDEALYDTPVVAVKIDTRGRLVGFLAVGAFDRPQWRREPPPEPDRDEEV